MSDEHLATLTHVRLRAAQGDVAAARRMLQAILADHPDYIPARMLLERLEALPREERSGSRSGDDRARAGVNDPLRPEGRAAASGLAGDAEGRAAVSARQRIERLERWLAKISRDGASGP